MTFNRNPIPAPAARAALALTVAVLFLSCGGRAGGTSTIGPSPGSSSGGSTVKPKILAWEVADNRAATIAPDAGTANAFTIDLNTVFFVQLYVENPATPNTRMIISMQGLWPGVYPLTVITETDQPSGRIMAARHGFQTPTAPSARDNYSIRISLSEEGTLVGEETLTINLKQ